MDYYLRYGVSELNPRLEPGRDLDLERYWTVGEPSLGLERGRTLVPRGEEEPLQQVRQEQEVLHPSQGFSETSPEDKNTILGNNNMQFVTQKSESGFCKISFF